MPKDNDLLIEELQKQRKKIKASAAKFSPSLIHLKIVGNGSKAEPRAVLLVTDHTNYLFNCGEGTQRLATEHHVKLTKLEHIFVTRPTWKNMGGIPGVQLSIQDAGVPRVVIHGPEGTVDLVEATKNFVKLKQLEVLTADLSNQFCDDTMTVTYVLLENSKIPDVDDSVSEVKSENQNLYDSVINADISEKSQKRIKSIMAYVCKIHPRPGKLDVKKSADFGVPPGPLLAKLKAGQDVTLPDGKVVKSQDVVSPAEPGPLFIVVECPDEDWIDIIVENPVFVKHQKAAGDKELLARYIVHFTPEKIINNSKYKEWMSKFGTETEHLILNEKNTGYTSEAIHKMQYQLNLVHPTIFPLLHGEKPVAENLYELFDDETSQTEVKNSNFDMKIDQNVELPQKKDNLHYCQTLNRIHLRPPNGFEFANVQIDPVQYCKDLEKIKGCPKMLQNLCEIVNGLPETIEGFEKYPRLVMLGTGCSIPNKIRNTSGMLLQIDESRSIILDCGEGTLGQMYRLFGEAEIGNVLKNIKAVYVSHLHADHHLGLIGILKERELVTDEPVFLLAPQHIQSYLYIYHNRFESISKLFRLVNNYELLKDQVTISDATAQELYEALNVSNITTCFVKHCWWAFGVSIILNDGRKVSYSGDTMPCETFVELAQGSDLMIHEATMEDNLEDEAAIKFHSTISQAINVGIFADAKFILLTHFSQRYSKIPMLPFKEGEGGADFTRVGIAYDFMVMSLSQLTLLPLFYPSLNLMFSEFRTILDGKTSKRELRKEQAASSVVDSAVD